MTTAAAAADREIRTPWSEFWRRFAKQKAALVAGTIALAVVLAALLAPVLAPYDPTFTDYDAVLDLPSAAHWAGTDEFGRDIFSRILFGARLSLAVGFSAVIVGMTVGTLLGVLAGYYGGWIDSLVMRASDVLFAFPGILLAIGIVAVLGSGLVNVIVAVAIFSVPTFARLVRGSTLALKASVYVDAAKAIGAADRTIILRHILPGTVSTVVVYMSLRIGTAIITASSLSFIGMGAPIESPEWGSMLSRARDYLTTAPHYATAPSLAIFVTVLVFNLLGDGLRDALDPRLDRS